MKVADKISDIVSYPFSRIIIYYLIYSLFIALSHTVVVSVTTFFQFQLKYPASMIENWIYDSSWLILISTKTLAFILILPFLYVLGESKKPVQNLFEKGAAIYQKRESFVLVTTLTLFFVVLGRPNFNEINAFSFIRFVTTFFGVITFYLYDILLLLFITNTRPLLRWYERPLLLLILPVIFWWINKVTFSYALAMDRVILFHFAVTMFLSHFQRHGVWLTPLLYLIFIVIPLTALFGYDPFWKSSYSLFKMGHEISSIELVGLLLIIVIYEKYRMPVAIKLKERWRDNGSAT